MRKPRTPKPRAIEVYDTPSNLGGSFTVSIKEHLPDNRVRVRVWYGRATVKGWEAWTDWDGYVFETDMSKLTNKQTMALYSERA